jgi:hypothetical protein
VHGVGCALYAHTLANRHVYRGASEKLVLTDDLHANSFVDSLILR